MAMDVFVFLFMFVVRPSKLSHTIDLKYIHFFMVFLPKKLFHPNVIDDYPIKFMSYNNMRCLIKQPYGRGIPLSRHCIMCCMI